MGNESSRPGEQPQQLQKKKKKKQQQRQQENLTEEADVGQTQYRQRYVERRQIKDSQLPLTPSNVSVKKALPDPVSVLKSTKIIAGTGKQDHPYAVDSEEDDCAGPAQPKLFISPEAKSASDQPGNALTFGFENRSGNRDIAKADSDIECLLKNGYKQKRPFYTMQAAQDWLHKQEKKAKTSSSQPARGRAKYSGSLTLTEGSMKFLNKFVPSGISVGNVKSRSGKLPQYSIDRIINQAGGKLLVYFVSPTHPNFAGQLLQFIANQKHGVKQLVVLCGEDEAVTGNAYRDLVWNSSGLSRMDDGVGRISKMTWMHSNHSRPPFAHSCFGTTENKSAAGLFVLLSRKSGYQPEYEDRCLRLVADDVWEAMAPHIA